MGYDSSSVSLPKRREEWRYLLYENKTDQSNHINEIRHNDPTVAVSIGPVNRAQIPFAPAKTLENEKRAITKRLIHEHVLPSTANVQALKKYVRENIIPHIEPLAPNLGFEELSNIWHSENSYSATRSQQLKDLADKYFLGHVYDDFYHCKMFMKEEFYPEAKHARMIISRSDQFKAVVGPYIHQFDHELFKGYFADHFIKGKDPSWVQQRMKQICAAFPIYMETDYSSFEGSQCLAIQRALERMVFKHYFKNYPEIFELINNTYDIKLCEEPPEGLIDTQGLVGREKYAAKQHNRELINEKKYFLGIDIHSNFHKMHLVGDRKSGELWTSSGNGFLNLCIMSYLANLHGLTWDGIVEGDDGFFGLYQSKITSKDYTALGFTIKLNYETDPNQLSFCGQRFTSDGTFVVDPELLNRVGWCEKRKYFKASKKTKLQLLKAKAMSLYVKAPQCPVTSRLCHTIISSIRAKEKIGIFDLYHKEEYLRYKTNLENLEYTPPSHSARVDYSEMFGVSLRTQEIFEQHFQSNPFDDFYFISDNGGIYMDSYDTGYERGTQ